MIVPSIDLSGGRTVQLVGGEDLAVDAGDPRPLLEAFSIVGETAVIDIDAARGEGSNASLIEELCGLGPIRVGGGIRDYETAMRWLETGASKIIIGTAATPDLLSRLPRDRVIVALDSREGLVVTNGWRRQSPVSVPDAIADLRDLCDGFLLTFVEREGRLEGTDLQRASEYVKAADGRSVTIAGGVTTVDEVAELDRLGADAQVGMALYTGRFSVADAVAAVMTSDREDGLWPTIVTDQHGIALGLAWSDRESLGQAIETRRGVYRSRSRGLWVKGETSGAGQELIEVSVDCDRDALRFRVRQDDPGFCHQDTRTCFGSDRGLPRLSRRLESILATRPSDSNTVRLASDAALLASKLSEEASELGNADGAAEVAAEAADLVYFTLVKAASAGVPLEEVGRILDQRESAAIRRPMISKPRSAAEIVEEVRRGGEPALRRLSEQFGDLGPGDRIVYGPSDLEAAAASLDEPHRDLLLRVADRIETFARAQRSCLMDLSTEIVGGTAGHRWVPIEAVGAYAPGGRYPLPSSVLMTVVPARVAGVSTVWVASPRPTQLTLAAASIAGADGLIAVGGAQAIAALAFGTVSPSCDLIVGPGNRWVTDAKKHLFGEVGIDGLAGPSEILVIADAGADPSLVAADLIAQAEHDVDARAALVTTNQGVADSVLDEIDAQLADLPTAEVAGAALENLSITVVDSMVAAAAEANRAAPEHLALHVAEPESIQRGLTSYGSVFVGDVTAEAFADYGAGPNHVLPTGGNARFQSGLSVATFLKTPTWMRLDNPEAIREDTALLARLEGLEGHARAAIAR